MTDVKSFRASRRKTIELEDGQEFLVKKLDLYDVLKCGGNPDILVLKGDTQEEQVLNLLKEGGAMLGKVLKDIAEKRIFMEKLSELGAVKPKISRTEQSEDSEILHTGDFTTVELDTIAGGILKFSGFQVKEAEAMGPSSATQDSSPPSTVSPEDTEDAQAKSSE